jgi:hypothetical protein
MTTKMGRSVPASARARTALGGTQSSAERLKFSRLASWLGLLLLGIAIGHFTHGEAPAIGAAASQETATRPSAGGAVDRRTSGQARVERFLVRPSELYVAKDEAAEQVYRKQQSKDLVDLLRAVVARAEAGARPEWGPEGVANDTAMYLNGWLDGVVRTAPDMLEELSAELEQTMCDEHSSGGQLVVMSRLVTMMPELANPKALDCVFSAHADEDSVLWYGIDAWRRSGLPKSEALANIERNAKDPRTLERFLTPQERVQRNAPEMERVIQDHLAPSSEPTDPAALAAPPEGPGAPMALQGH